MDKDAFWNFFTETGDIEFYLMYKEKAQDEKEPEQGQEPA